jgi:hypothetical protein
LSYTFLQIAVREGKTCGSSDVSSISRKFLAQIRVSNAFYEKRPVFPQQDKVRAMQQLSAVHTIPGHLARFALLFAAIAILRYSDILLDGLATTAGYGLHRLTQELWMFCR